MTNKVAREEEVHVPNQETIEALKEVEAIKKNPGLAKIYHNVEEMMAELCSEESDSE